MGGKPNTMILDPEFEGACVLKDDKEHIDVDEREAVFVYTVSAKKFERDYEAKSLTLQVDRAAVPKQMTVGVKNMPDYGHAAPTQGAEHWQDLTTGQDMKKADFPKKYELVVKTGIFAKRADVDGGVDKPLKADKYTMKLRIKCADYRPVVGDASTTTSHPLAPFDVVVDD